METLIAIRPLKTLQDLLSNPLATALVTLMPF
jgi:hypothetical protein